MVVGIGMLVYGLFFLKGLDPFGEKRNFYIKYDNIGGLNVSGKVNVNGYQVGQVTDITLVQDTSEYLMVEITVQNPDLKIPSDSRAVISSDLLGTGSIDLKMGSMYSDLVPNNGALIGVKAKELQEEVNDQILPLKIKLEGLLASVDSAVEVVNVILNPNTRDNLEQSFVSIRRAMLNLERTSFRLDTMVASEQAKISRIMSNIDAIALNLNNNQDNLNNIITNFSAISDTLVKADIATTIDHAKNTMDDVSEIMDKINNGEGSMGLLINDTTLHSRIDQTVSDLDFLINEITTHPEEYVRVSVFGRKPKRDFNNVEVKKIKDIID